MSSLPNTNAKSP